MMVKQTRILFELSDILRIRLVCNSCDGEIAYQLGRALSLRPPSFLSALPPGMD